MSIDVIYIKSSYFICYCCYFLLFIVCLSALMTTTVPAMQEAIDLIKEKAPHCKTIVGGAVLTQEYADKIGADKYAKDAMEAVRYAEEIFSF